MVHIITTLWGGFNTRSPSGTALNPVTIPTGVTRRGYRTTFARSRRTSVLNGRFDPSLAWYDHLSLLRRGGMLQPAASTPPTVISAGAGSIDAIVIYYYTGLEISGTDELAESSTSDDSVPLTLANQQATVTVPATFPDARATHIVIYRSDDGDAPKRVGTVTIGTTTFTDNVASGARTLEVPLFADGSVIPDSRDPAPFCRFVLCYKQRNYYFGDLEHPERMHAGLLDEPEAVPSGNYKDTLGREAITAGAGFADQILVFCHNKVYEFLDYGDNDFVMRKLADGIGCISHHSIAYDTYGRIWFAAQDGVYMYDGQFHYMSEDVAYYWKEDYKANRERYEDSVGVVDKYWMTYRLLTPQKERADSTYENSLFWVGAIQHLDPARVGVAQEQSAQPSWSFDVLARRMTAQGILVDEGDQEHLYSGSGDGVLYQENIDDDADDDGDSYQKKFVVRTGAVYPGGQASGPVTRGTTIKSETLYLRSEVPWVYKVWSGSDKALQATAPTFGPYTFPANAGEAGKTDEVEKYIRPTGCSGKAHIREVSIVNVKTGEAEYRGHSWEIAPGPHSRGAIT